MRARREIVARRTELDDHEGVAGGRQRATGGRQRSGVRVLVGLPCAGKYSKSCLFVQEGLRGGAPGSCLQIRDETPACHDDTIEPEIAEGTGDDRMLPQHRPE